MITDILSGIDDQKKLVDRPKEDVALNDLVQSYIKRTTYLELLPKVTPEWTGKDLKSAISQMPNEDQVALLHCYSVTVKDECPLADRCAEEEKNVEERHLRHWIIKVLIIGFAVISCVLTGAVVVVGVRSGVVADGAIVKSIMITATEILKLIFTTSV